MIKALQVFFKRMRQKRPTKLDNGFIHTAGRVKDYLGKKNIQMLAPCSPDLALSDYFLFPKVRKNAGR